MVRARPFLPAVCLLCLALNSARAAEDGVPAALRDLGSPYLETRERAVSTLASGGAAAAAAMTTAYPVGDFRTKALILAAFARGEPALGMEVLFKDLGCPERGVVTAQRGLVTALYRQASEFATRRVVPLLPRGDWEWEEGVRALPCRAPSARKALARLRDSDAVPLRNLFKPLQASVAAVDRLRVRLAAARADENAEVAGAAREFTRLLVRHDVERAFFAVHRAGGGDGTYDGMYAVVKEVAAVEGPVVTSALVWILDDAAPPEEGVPPAGSTSYPFLEPVPLDMTSGGVRRRAAFCLGDLGDPGVVSLLLERYEKFEKEDLDPYDTPRQDVAHALAALGEPGPLEEIVREYLAFDMGSEWQSRLAACYARLGELELAIASFEKANEGASKEWLYHYNLACALSRLGRIREALAALQQAISAGYGQDPSNIRWMERDGDLDAVRKLPAYQAMLTELRSRFR